MSIWVSVYCQKQIGRIDPFDFTAGIKERLHHFSDLFAQEDSNDVLARLRVEETDPSDVGSRMLLLQYLEGNLPVVIYHVESREVAIGQVQEYLEERFQDREGAQAALVREHLANTVEIVNFSLKQFHWDGMGMPLVYAAAAWLAEQGNGMLRADEQGWMYLDVDEWITLCAE